MSELIWQLTKKNNAFLVKKANFTFSKDPFNLTNRNMASVSGLAQNYGVSIAPARKEAGNPSRYDIRFQKKVQYQTESKPARQNKGKGKVNTINADLKDSFFTEHVPVKGLHTASRVIRRKYAIRGRHLKDLALRRLARAHRASFKTKEVKAEKKN
jgi:large subunit ribosomal protein L28e